MQKIVPHRVSDARIERAERALAAAVGLGALLLAVYAIGMTGVPGELFSAALDRALAWGWVDAQAPAVQIAAAIL